MTRRAYDNSLRTEQAEQTKLRILQAAVEMVSDGQAVATATIATRAGVSEPTVYRYFPNREVLVSAVAEYASSRLGSPPVPATLEELGTSAIAMALYMGRNKTFIRAGMRDPEYREARAKGRKQRIGSMRKLLAPVVTHLDEHDREVAFASVASVMRGETWDYLTSELELTDEDAGRAIAFVLEACTDKLAQLARKKRTKIVDDASVKRAHELDADADKKGRG